jgi:redox-sensitive bicupin YhaK (pirin superfamily)
MKKILHHAADRGHADHGWLNTYHSFSFGNYYDPARIHFGALRVLNDDVVAPGKGFGTHPHDNMEIVTIPITGALEHRDNTGRHGVIRSGDVQIMSAGTGITHSEFNASPRDPVNLLQIWILPAKKNITPRYDQRNFPKDGRVNRWQVVVAPRPEEDALWINQEAWFAMANLQQGQSIDWVARQVSGGAYLFVIGGKVSVAEENLGSRDGLGILDYGSELRIHCEQDAELLILDLPM